MKKNHTPQICVFSTRRSCYHTHSSRLCFLKSQKSRFQINCKNDKLNIFLSLQFFDMLKKSSVAIVSYIFPLEKPCFSNFLKAFNFLDMCGRQCNLTNMQILSFKDISLRHTPNVINIWPKRANKGKQITRVRNFKHLQSFYFFLSY